MKHDALSQEYDPGAAESEDSYEGTPLKNTPSKSKSASPAVTHRPAIPRKKDVTVIHS